MTKITMGKSLFVTLNLIIGIILLLSSFDAVAQMNPIMESKLRSELKAKDISEDEVLKRMLLRGINPADVNDSNYSEYEGVLREVIEEIEAEKLSSGSTNASGSNQSPSTNIDTASHVKNVQVEQNTEVVEAMADKSKELVIKTPRVSTGIYGHDLFKNADIDLYQSTDVLSAPPSYVLTHGDLVRVSIFGPSQADFLYKINEEGFIQPADMPKIYLRGLTLAEAEKLTMNRFSRRYSFLPEQFSMVLNSSRDITINIFGEVEQPGSYNVSALNTGLNAIVAAGGPTKYGSVREIRLVKGNGEVKILDVYAYLSNPKVQYDFPIDDQDIIYIPLSKKIVKIEGGIRRPMRYEIKEKESLADLIEFAGGFSNVSHSPIIQVSRITNSGRKIIDVDMNSTLYSRFQLENEDIVAIQTNETSTVTSYVAISGAVKYPGQYAYSNGMKLREVINKAQLVKDVKKDLAYVFRSDITGRSSLIKIDLSRDNLNGFVLQERDKIVLFTKRQFLDQKTGIAVSGAVRNPGVVNVDIDQTVKISDLISLSGGLKKNASYQAILTRRDSLNSQIQSYLRINLDSIFIDNSKDIYLRSGDALNIYTNERYTNQYFVQISGEVRDPGQYVYDSTLTLREVLMLSGGAKNNATDNITIRRRALDNNQEVEFLKLNINSENTLDMPLQPGDQIRVYDKNLFMDSYSISLVGEVRNALELPYDPSLTLEKLIYMAGGLTMKAAKNRVEVYTVEMIENEPTRILQRTIDITNDVDLSQITFDPFDIIIVRTVPDFHLQKMVRIEGRVRYPGPYVLTSEEVRLKDIIEKAGGLSVDAFPAGAELIRSNGNRKGKIVINLEDALSIGNNHENILLLAGDVIKIPKAENTISIRTQATQAKEILTGDQLTRGQMNMAYQGKHHALWYIRNFAGGLDEDASKKSIKVILQNGQILSTKRFLGIFYKYPVVEEGSTIQVSFKPPPPPKEKKRERKEIDWGLVIRDSFAILSSAFTVIALAYKIFE